MISVLGSLLLAHMVADYPLQTDWMAENKHDDPDALISHSVVHAVVAFIAVWALSGPVGMAVAIAFPLGIIHGTIDAQDWFIRWDQTAHLLTAVVLSLPVL